MIFFIDICGTLYRSNTTFDFLDFWFKQELWYKRMKQLRRFRVIGFANSLCSRLFHIDILRRYAISHLRGYRKDELRQMSKLFYDEHLSTVINNDVVKIIEDKRKQGCELIAVSATLDFIAEEICQRLNIPKQFSSTLGYDKDGICIGRLTKDWLACKLNNLKQQGYCPPYDYVITDNFSDSDVICNSKFSYLIQYSNCKKSWNDVFPLDSLNYTIINK